MLKFVFATLAAAIVINPAQAFSRDKNDGGGDRTGICARKLSWLDQNHVVHTRLETIIYKQSLHIDVDVRRKGFYEQTILRPYLPEMTPYVWMGAWVSDTSIDDAHGPSCSKLPPIVESNKPT